MFGYIRAYTPEMKVRENEYYKAVYCGLCHAYGKCIGCASRLTLSYDFVFLALLRMALDDTITPEFEKKRCFVHPMRKRAIMKPNAQSEYCVRAAVLLCYHKCLDDIKDEKKGSGKHFRAKLTLPAFKRMQKRAAIPELDDIFKTCLSELSELEGEGGDGVASVDRPAAVFGELMSKAAAYGFEGGKKIIAGNIGRHIGKWIYIIDALDDYDGDIAAGRYNPFARLYGTEGLSEERREYIKIALTAELMDAEKAFNLIDYGDKTDINGIINNIIYLGMPRTASEIIDGKTNKKAKNNEKGEIE